jgi:hypothetical protein
MDRPVVSVVLLPNGEDSKAVTECSAAISQATHSLITLDESHLPHISVAQFFAPYEAASALWEEMNHLKTEVSELVSTGISFIPGRERERTWVELGFLKAAALVELQEQVLQTNFASKYELHIGTGTGDAYRPHITMALLDAKRSVGIDLAPYPIFSRPLTGLRFVVGINGENYTFTKALFE